jgi:predicted TIM-barrel fold metal-dependent hydrolase
MIIDFASRPPLPEFIVQSAHMSNYRRVYSSSESLVGKDVGENALAEYIAMYDRIGAAHVVIKARNAQSTMGFKVTNEDVARFCKAHSPRFIGFASVDPHHGADAVTELEYAIRELGLAGLNIQGFENKLAINDAKLMPLYSKCEELGVPVNVHCGMNFSTSSSANLGHPMALDDVLMRFPRLRVCASPPGWPWITEVIAMAWRHENLWIGLSAVRPKLLATANSGYEQLLKYGSSLLKHRIIFGSGYPMIPVERSVAEVAALGLPTDICRAWLGSNAADLLGLQLPTTPSVQ